MKNNIVKKYWYKEIHRFDITNSLIIFFLSIVAIYQIHYWTKGIVLSSPLFTFISFLILFLIFSIKIWPWMKINEEYDRDSRDWKWIIVSLLAVSLVMRFWIGISNIPGDYGTHKQFVLQLLNGAVEGHNLYKETPGYYPPITHTTIAVLTNLSGLYVQHSFMLASVLISFFIPLISYKLAKKLGFSPVLSLFFSGLISLYGGLGQSEQRIPHLYLPAIQMYLPFISRNISFLLFLSFLFLCFKNTGAQQLSYNISISIGVLIGLLGLTQPHGFFAALLFIFIHYGIHFKIKCMQKEIMLHLLISVLIGCTLASIDYVPLYFKMAHYGGLVKHEQLPEAFPVKYFWLYGPLPFLGLYALWNIKNDTKSWMLSALLFVISIVFIRFFLGQVISIAKWFVFLMHRYSTYMFIFLALSATAGFDNLFRFIKKMRYVVIVTMILIVLIGYSTAIKYLDDEWRSSGINIREVIGTGNFFPERGIEKLRFLVPNPLDVLIVPPVPPELARTVAHETGLPVAYYQYYRVMFNKETITQEERFKMVDAFYEDLEDGIIRKDVLSFFKTNIFLSPYYDLEKKRLPLKKITSVKVDDKEYFLYKIND
jgi:hypothetical protein